MVFVRAGNFERFGHGLISPETTLTRIVLEQRELAGGTIGEILEAEKPDRESVQ